MLIYQHLISSMEKKGLCKDCKYLIYNAGIFFCQFFSEQADKKIFYEVHPLRNCQEWEQKTLNDKSSNTTKI